MKKRQILVIFSLLFSINATHIYADESISIISRQEWGADETLRYLSSPEWQSILKKQQEIAINPLTDAQKKAVEAKKKKDQQIAEYFENKFPDEQVVVEKISQQTDEELAWPIAKTNQVRGIVIHHTDTNYEGSHESVRKIYRYHTLSRGWGDIGYNYLVGYDGEIFEGRAGGDYAVGAHALYNNYGTVSISLIGEYDESGIGEKQYESLSKLVLFLSKKYGIDLNKKVYFHTECKTGKCDYPLEPLYTYPIIGHRDVAATTCPGDDLYAQIQQVLKENQKLTKGLNPVTLKGEKTKKALFTLTKSKKKIDSYLKLIESKKAEDILELLASIEEKISLDIQGKEKELIVFKQAILDYFQKNPLKQIQTNSKTSFDDTQDIKVKLSYPHTGSIDIQDGKTTYKFVVEGNMLKIGERKIQRIEIRPKKSKYLTISSWERIPAWDTQKLYNDNIFLGSIVLSVHEGEIQVVNKLKLSDYLKGLGEVSNSDDTEKIKTIIIAARTYARYYMGTYRKFPGEEYDGSDNPDEFQKYLGYGYQKRSTNVTKVVDETQDMVITYKDTIIKPWYFHSSNGVTKSYFEYCIGNKNEESFCKKESQKYPYLRARKDIGSLGKDFQGHGVGISGDGASFFARREWTADMIINYYLKGTQVKIKGN